jgi:hypothetical protein
MMSGRETVTNSGIKAVKEARVPAVAAELGDSPISSVGAFRACAGAVSGGKNTLAMNIPTTKSSTTALKASILFNFLLDRGAIC